MSDSRSPLNPYESPRASVRRYTAIPVESNPAEPLVVRIVGRRWWGALQLQMTGLIEADLECADSHLRVNGRKIWPKFLALQPTFRCELDAPEKTFLLAVEVRQPFLHPFVPLRVRVWVDEKLAFDSRKTNRSPSSA